MAVKITERSPTEKPAFESLEVPAHPPKTFGGKGYETQQQKPEIAIKIFNERTDSISTSHETAIAKLTQPPKINEVNIGKDNFVKKVQNSQEARAISIALNSMLDSWILIKRFFEKIQPTDFDVFTKVRGKSIDEEHALTAGILTLIRYQEKHPEYQLNYQKLFDAVSQIDELTKQQKTELEEKIVNESGKDVDPLPQIVTKTELLQI